MYLTDRLPGDGALALIGGGEFSFGETAEADRLWLERAPEGAVGFLPAASGSTDYAGHFAAYLGSTFGREVEPLPIYRPRDARRRKNVERIDACSAVYVGGGVADHLLEALLDTPALDALERCLLAGGVVVAIAAAAQAFGHTARSLTGNQPLAGLGWLDATVIEPGFDPGHDRRLRWLLEQPGVEYGLGVPAGSALLFAGDRMTVLGPVFELRGPDDDLSLLREAADGADRA